MTFLNTSFAVLVAGMMSTAAFAMSDSASKMDANGDGVLTIDEVQTVHPDVTADSFSAMDVNADGALDDTEITAAEDAGVMPTDG